MVKRKWTLAFGRSESWSLNKTIFICIFFFPEIRYGQFVDDTQVVTLSSTFMLFISQGSQFLRRQFKNNNINAISVKPLVVESALQ